MDAKKWFHEAKFGIMVHWGLYSLFGGEWKGKRMPGIGEWSQSYFQIPNAEYEQLTKAFQPICFSAKEWVKFAQDCGAQYFVVTAKHHEGFCMYHSRVDRYNVVNQTPFGRDVIDEIGEACYKYGMRLGLYYSQALDWHEEHGGGYDEKISVCAGTTWDNSWDFRTEAKRIFPFALKTKSSLRSRKF
ncbi:MAG: alpha-L-fucosidase [Clostridia bacterium]|nr:alpha-L-fucosidase [Clostridia bacterium]